MQQVSKRDADELFEMANLFPRTTGLPMTVWVSRATARHDVRVEVNMAHGDQMNIANTGGGPPPSEPAYHHRPFCRPMISGRCSNGYR